MFIASSIEGNDTEVICFRKIIDEIFNESYLAQLLKKSRAKRIMNIYETTHGKLPDKYEVNLDKKIIEIHRRRFAASSR